MIVKQGTMCSKWHVGQRSSARQLALFLHSWRRLLSGKM